MLPVDENGTSGWQMCNLTEQNGNKITDLETLLRSCKAAAIMGTLQAGYTNFKYLTDVSKRIVEREALIGVSITGWMNNPDTLFNKENLEAGAKMVNETNKLVANLIGINQAARTTCTKPSGNASVVLGCDGSGIHGAHSPLYFRNVQMTDNDEVAQLIKKINPSMIEKSVWSSSGTDLVVSFPIVSKDGSLYKKELMGVKQLEKVKFAQQYWVEPGTNVELCTDPRLRHNISNTISVDDWDEVEEYIYNNMQWFAGISLLNSTGDKDYAQAPFTEVLTEEQMLKQYGIASMFASGLIVDGMHAFNDNLWLACDTALGKGLTLTEDSNDLLKRDWIRRAHKFAKNYLNNDILKMTYCLKDCYNLHKWQKIQQTMQEIEFEHALKKQVAIDVDTLASQACAGGSCEVVF